MLTRLPMNVCAACRGDSNGHESSLCGGPDAVVSVKTRLRAFVGSRPALFFPMYRLARRSVSARALQFNAQTALVVEGFPRSGNTFAVVAFQMAQPSPVALAHHLHHPAQVLRAVQRGVPTMVLIRQPVAAVRSLALRRPSASMASLIQQYVDFYKPLAAVRGGYYLADFAEVTTDFGAVTRAVNNHFGTAFACFDHCAENVSSVFAEIDRINRALGGDESHVSRPSAVREMAAKHAFTRSEARLLGEADAVYQAVT